MFNLNSIEYTTKTRYSMFKLINFYFFWKIIINLEFGLHLVLTSCPNNLWNKMQGSLKLDTFLSQQSFKLLLEDYVIEDCTCFHVSDFTFFPFMYIYILFVVFLPCEQGSPVKET